MHPSVLTVKKLVSLFISVLILNSFSSIAQKNKPKELTPARGHYKQLSAVSAKQKSSNEEIDKQKFPTDKETIDRRLSLTPIYLQNIKVDDFRIPEAPANSSDQTRAEINYLLALQKYRTKEDVRSSLYMADVYYNLRVRPGDSTYTRYRNNLFFIGRSIGSWFNPETLPVTADFMANVW